MATEATDAIFDEENLETEEDKKVVYKMVFDCGEKSQNQAIELIHLELAIPITQTRVMTQNQHQSRTTANRQR